jgi:hypothetical protein
MKGNDFLQLIPNVWAYSGCINKSSFYCLTRNLPTIMAGTALAIFDYPGQPIP